MLRKTTPFALALALLAAACAPTAQEVASNIETVTLPSPDSPLIPVRLMFKVGSIHDPAGKEGLAALTGMMVAEVGITEEEFELTRDFVTNYSKLWARTLSNRLGFLMDSKFYGMPYYIDEIDSKLANMTVDDVNAAIKEYLQTDNFHAVMVTNNAAEVQAYLEADGSSPMQYNTAPEPEVVEDDKVIDAIKVAPDSVSIVPIGEMFQR